MSVVDRPLLDQLGAVAGSDVSALPVGASRWLWSVDDVHRAYLP
ncbi:hypothetical protein [Saccharothrix sp. ALI-22-I]|nr:hypothetical protein [Saccharothrix sp. ALI-22-I]